MPAKDPYNEILIAISTGIIIFLVITIMIIFILLFYQKKRFQHRQLVSDMKKQFSEELFKSQLEIQEQTFNDISQEIHDNVGQILSLAKVQINIMNESEYMSRDMLNEVKDNVGKAMSDLRDIAKSLSSDRIKMMGIHTAVRGEIDRINKSGALQATIVVRGDEKKMNEQKKLILFRVIQESLQNIIKHAHASEVLLTFDYQEELLMTTIRDNGQGFEIKEAQARNTGLGLVNIQTRTMLAGGASSIESIPGQGTAITINMPYE